MRTASVLSILLILVPLTVVTSAQAQDCESIPYSNDQVGMQTFHGLPGDTVWAPVWAITDSTLIAFRIIIQFDSLVLKPVPTYPGSEALVVEPAGRFAGSAGLSAVLSQRQGDSSALVITFLPGLNVNDTIPPGKGVILRIPFVVQQQALFIEYSLLSFPRRTIYLDAKLASQPESLATCWGTDFVEQSSGPAGTSEGFPRPSIALFYTSPALDDIPRIDYFTINPRSARQGDSTHAYWAVRNCDSVVLYPALGMHPSTYQDETLVVAEDTPTLYEFIAFGGGSTITRSIRLLAVPPGANRYPYWQYFPDPLSGPVLQPISVYLWADDPDGQQPTFSSPNLPPGATLTVDGGFNVLFRWTPSAADTGFHLVSFIVHDSLDPLLYDSMSCAIYVRDANYSPTWSYDNSDRTMLEKDTLTIVVTASDPNQTVPSIEARLLFGDTLATNMSFIDSGNGVGIFTFVPDYFQGNLGPTYYLVRFRVRDAVDPSLYVLTDPVHIYVHNRNSGLETPVLTLSAGEGPFDMSEGDSLIFEVIATTSIGDLPVISADTLPPTASLLDYPGTSAGNYKVFRFKPGDGMAGEYRVKFYATNLDLPDSVSVDITVFPHNNVPVVLLLPGNDIIYEEDTARVVVLALDPDSTTPVITAYLDGADTLARNMTMVDSGNGVGVLTFIPNRVQGSPCGPVFFYLRFRATDTVPPYPYTLSSVRTIRVYDSGLPCCIGTRGDVNYDGNGSGYPKVSDLTYMISYLFRGGAPLPCNQEGDTDGSGGISVMDVTYLISHLFRGGPLPVECPPTRSPGDTGPACQE